MLQNKRLESQIKVHWPYIVLAVLFIFYTYQIFMRAYFGGAMLVSDSLFYLEWAESILHGKEGKVFSGWTYWPVGYPFLIAAVAFVTGAEIYLASVILSVLIVAGMFLLFLRYFKRDAWIFAFVICADLEFLEMSSIPMSDLFFTMGILWLSLELKGIISDDNPPVYHYLNIIPASLLAFLSRYMGAAALPLIGAAFVFCLVKLLVYKQKQNLKKCILLVIAGILVLAAIAGYLYLNYRRSGTTGGPSIIPAKNHIGALMHTSWKQMSLLCAMLTSIISNINFRILFALVFIYFTVLFFIKKRQPQVFETVLFFMIAGIIYFVILLLALQLISGDFSDRIDAGYWEGNGRYYLPSTISFAIAFITIILEYRDIMLRKAKRLPHAARVFWLSALVLFYGYNMFRSGVYYSLSAAAGSGYPSIRREIIADLESVLPDSLIVVSQNQHEEGRCASIIRTDLAFRNAGGFIINPSAYDKYTHIYLYIHDPELWPGNMAVPENIAPYLREGKRLVQIK